MKQPLLRMFSAFAILALMLGGLPTQSAQAAGSVSLTTLNVAYTQDFSTLAGTPDNGTSVALPTGWDFSESGSNANTTYGIGTGSNNAGNTYSFGSTASAERAFGGLLSGSVTPTIGASFTNNTGQTVTTLDVSYIGEMWRAGVLNRGAADRLDFQFSANATSLTTGTWTDYDSLDFNSPNLAATAGALNGNSVTNQASLSLSITGLSIPNGATFWIRWTDFNIASSDDGLAVDSFSITPRVSDLAPEVAATYPVNGATDFPINANLSVTFSEPVNVTSSWFTLVCSVSGTVTTNFSGGPTTFTLDPGVALTHGETCTLTVLANQVSDVDANDPPNNMAFNFIVGFSPYDVCAAPFTPIYNIQGSGLSAAITGTVTTKGVVVGDFEGSNSVGIGGFYIQDLTGDGNPATSDGIFVYTGSSNLVSVGQVVRVTGYARERFGQTTLNGSTTDSSVVPAANIVPCGTGSVSATDVAMPFANPDEPERFEGMLVRFPQALVIAEYFNYERFGEMVIALPLTGETRPFTGTAIDEPGAPALDRAYQNSLRRITLDNGLGAQNPSILRHPNGLPFGLNNLFRGGDTVANTVGVLGYDFGLYRIQPTGAADYVAANPRPVAPEAVGGSLRVAAMNTLNYFVTADYPTGNPFDNKCGPANSMECRGWDSDQVDEFTRQRTKLLQALAGLDADVIGLNELENSTGAEPLADIVAGLNDLLGAGTYAYVNTGTIGTDAIKVGLIYQPAKVALVGSYQILDSTDDPRFIDTKSRPSLAQTFQDLSTGGRFTVVVNHLKSKGSACDDIGDPDLGDGQGNCSQTRRAAAQALVDWLSTDPTGSGDPDFIIMGDLNSYAMEDAIDEIKLGSDDTAGTSDDFTNLISYYQGLYAYSYTFDGQAGYLDHALANASLLAQITGAEDWHINSDEPDVLDYDTTFKPPAQDALYEPNAYRTSDHDPVVVGMNVVNYAPELGSIAVSPTLTAIGTTVNASVSFTDPDKLDTHTATWDWGDGNSSVGAVSEANGAGTITGDHVYAVPGVYTVTVTVADGYGNTDTAIYEYVVVYDPNGGFVTGGGWIDSPAGAYAADPSLTGKATFGFVAKYQKGANVPVGNTEFQFKVGNLNFKSASYEWLVVAGSKAQFKGVGTINGEGSYQFIITAVDGQPDTFRMKIWYEDESGTHVVYDNGSQQAIGGGSIVVHK
ncbi:MAG: ExeM/NucH family extracellular endonuclease [Chloroflexi bacterium]|nr:ExeM/NucH family extracellular endonuclease [Chloroflexota bacterium]